MTRKMWTQEEIDILSRMYPDHFAKEIAGVLGRGVSSVYCKARQLGLECTPDKIRRSGLLSSGNPRCVASRFQKGNIPANKGKRMSPEVYAKAARTMFKKGNTPHNHREVGSERVNVDGYIEIKVAEPNKWRLKHRVVWERVNGAIPRGHNVQFRNHNPLDCRIENLYLISRAVHNCCRVSANNHSLAFAIHRSVKGYPRIEQIKRPEVVALCESDDCVAVKDGFMFELKKESR